MSSALFVHSDSRYYYLAKKLQQKNISVSFLEKNYNTPTDITLFCEHLSNYNYIFGPIPLTKDRITVNNTNIKLVDLLEALNPNQIFFSCNIPQEFVEALHQKHIPFVDYNDTISFQQKNAIATAEGAIACAITNSLGNLFQSNTLVLGYGCCGRQIIRQLAGFYPKLTVAGRRKETEIQVYCAGYQYLDLTQSTKNLSSYQYIFNTIPAQVLTESILASCNPDCTIIDIASAPGGLDYNYAKEKNINAHHYLGIPGKIAPKESANILYEIIESYLL